MRFSKSLKENHIFQRLYHKGMTAAGKYMVLYCRPNRLEHNRVGYTVGKKLGHAVTRNRARRRLREVYRLAEPSLRCGFDIVIVARMRCIEGRFDAMQAEFSQLAKKLSLWEDSQ